MSSSQVIPVVLPAFLVVGVANLAEGVETTELVQLVAQHAHEIARVHKDYERVRQEAALLKDNAGLQIKALQAEVERLKHANSGADAADDGTNPTGKDSSDATRGGEMDWTQCVSEGGKKNCGKCSNNDGMLLCDQAYPLEGKPADRAKACGDDTIASKGAVFLVKRTGGCEHLKDLNPTEQATITTLTGIVRTTYKFPGMRRGELVATQMLATHPHKAHQSVGVLAFKRLVTHTCTGKRPGLCKKGTKVADVFKLCTHAHLSSADTIITHHLSSAVDTHIP